MGYSCVLVLVSRIQRLWVFTIYLYVEPMVSWKEGFSFSVMQLMNHTFSFCEIFVDTSLIEMKAIALKKSKAHKNLEKWGAHPIGAQTLNVKPAYLLTMIEQGIRDVY